MRVDVREPATAPIDGRRSTASTPSDGRGLDDRLGARPARQHGAAGLGGRRRDRRLLAQRRRVAGHPQGRPSACPSPPGGRCASSTGDGDELARAEGTSDERGDHLGAARGQRPRRHLPLGRSGRPTAGATGRSRTDGPVMVDTAAPGRRGRGRRRRRVPLFTPNGDGSGDTIGFAVGRERARVRDRDGPRRRRRRWSTRVSTTVGARAAPSPGTAATTDGAYVADGTYTLELRGQGPGRQPQRGAGPRPSPCTGPWPPRRARRPVFFPQDGDSLATPTTFSFRLRSAAATVDLDGRRTPPATSSARSRTARPLAAGTQAFAWNGRNDAGAHRAARHLPRPS